MEDKKEETIKKIFKEKVVCPHCNKKLIVTKTKTIKSPAIPADIVESVYAEKDNQTTLNEDMKEDLKKKSKKQDKG